MRAISYDDWLADAHAEIRFMKDGAEIIGDICYMFQDWVEEEGHGVWDNGGEMWSNELCEELCAEKGFEMPELGELVYALYDDEGHELLIAFRGKMENDAYTVESKRLLKNEIRIKIPVSI